jgi:putative phosphoribosyl transferase
VHDDPAVSVAAAAGSDADRPDPAPGARALSLARADRAGGAPAGSRALARADLTRFADRRAAGRALGERLALDPPVDPVVLGLPRGGVIVAAEVAAALHAPLDVLVVRKLGLPAQPELAMGAIAVAGETLETVRMEHVLAAAHVDEEMFAQVRDREFDELRRREAAYRGDRPPLPLSGRDVVLVDDGLATGATMRVAVVAVRRQHPRRLLVAVPIGAPRACAALEQHVDLLVCLEAPRGFRAVGQGYADFAETTDDQVRTALA